MNSWKQIASYSSTLWRSFKRQGSGINRSAVNDTVIDIYWYTNFRYKSEMVVLGL